VIAFRCVGDTVVRGAWRHGTAAAGRAGESGVYTGRSYAFYF
jgi:hypothetical protein